MASAKTNLKFTVVETALGWVGLVRGLRGLVRSTLPVATHAQALLEFGSFVELARRDDRGFEKLARRVEGYCRGDKVDLTTEKVDLGDRTAFFTRAWLACRSIGRGEVRSYGWLAGRSGNVLASRAAGQAMARNPVPLFVPCHRVINSQGKLHNFGGGLPLKQRLLQLEGYRPHLSTRTEGRPPVVRQRPQPALAQRPN